MSFFNIPSEARVPIEKTKGYHAPSIRNVFNPGSGFEDYLEPRLKQVGNDGWRQRDAPFTRKALLGNTDDHKG